MSLQVYFDSTLIDEKYYTGLTNTYEMFNESFKLGATPSNTYKLRIAKEGVLSQPNAITLKDNGASFAELAIDNIEEQDYEYIYTLTDRMVDLDFKYDASQIFSNGSTTLYNIAMDICTKVGLTLGTTNFRGYNKLINWYDNTRTAREYIGFIAELNGGFARIENNVLYFRKQKTNSIKTISIDDCENFNIGEYHKITKVVYELGSLKYEYGNETGNTLYLNSDNVYITEASEVEAIYNEIKDLEFYSFATTNCPIDYSIKAGDIITFTDGTNNYPIIAQYDLEYFGTWIGGYNININTERQEETKLIDDKERIRDLKIIVDRQNNSITQVVAEVDEQNTKISQTQQTVNELNSKISDIADITTQAESIYASVSFESINQSEPIEIKIYPTTTNISYLYPRNNLYPSDTLYMPNRVLRFTNTSEYVETTDTYYTNYKKYYSYDDVTYTLLVAGTDYTVGNAISGTIYENEYIDYELPDDLLIDTNSGTYDEFYLGYDQHICQVTKRCEYNSDGSVSTLANETINTYAYPTINLTDGDYTVELIGYTNAYISARLMAQNIYTSQFATKAELSSSITQTENEINLKVDEKLDEEDFTSANIMLKINNDTSSATINADKVSLNGKSINLTSDNIAISSTYFNVDKYGNVNANSLRSNNATITGGQISLIDTGSNNNSALKLIDTNSSNYLKVYSNGVFVLESDGDGYTTSLNLQGLTTAYYSNDVAESGIIISNQGAYGPYIQIFNSSQSTMQNRTSLYYDGIWTPQVTQTSREEDKKNFELLQNALDIIKQTNIYKYNLKTQKDGDKKHIGFVIGENYKYAHEITSEREGQETGVDTYSMISVAYKAIQEQQEIIEDLQKQINELKGE